MPMSFLGADLPATKERSLSTKDGQATQRLSWSNSRLAAKTSKGSVEGRGSQSKNATGFRRVANGCGSGMSRGAGV
jgi:hypothetical protein